MIHGAGRPPQMMLEDEVSTNAANCLSLERREQAIQAKEAELEALAERLNARVLEVGRCCFRGRAAKLTDALVIVAQQGKQQENIDADREAVEVLRANAQEIMDNARQEKSHALAIRVGWCVLRQACPPHPAAWCALCSVRPRPRSWS